MDNEHNLILRRSALERKKGELARHAETAENRIARIDDEINQIDQYLTENASWQNAIEELEALAKMLADGHLTLFRFTTGWKACLNTIAPTPGSDDYHWLFSLPSWPTIEEACRNAQVHDETE